MARKAAWAGKWILFFCFVIIGVLVSAILLGPWNNEPSDGLVAVARVIDGDTIELSTGAVVRYIGVDTAETVHPNKPVECYGREASARNKQLVLGQRVRLEKDVSDKDKYGRFLRFVYLPNGTLVNLELVKEGYARAYTFPPDVSRESDFVAAQEEAKLMKLGIWGACPHPFLK